MTPKIAFVTDFDGTISDDDFFTYIARRYFDDKALTPWREYLGGTKTHFEALREMFSKLRVPETELKSFISEIYTDKEFVRTVALCFDKNIPVFICSAGCDYYINILIGEIIKNYRITLVTNNGKYDGKQGLLISKPAKTSPYYDEAVGISKASIVRKLQSEGFKVIYAGDGPPDIEAARLADYVFAKKILLEKCREEGIKTLPFRSFADISKFIKEV